LRSASFVDMTGADESTARNTLEASNWDLNDAVTLHFASQDAGGGGGGGAGGGGGGFGAAAAAPAGGGGDWGGSGGAGGDGMDEATRAAIAAAQAEMAVESPEVRKADEHIEDQLFDPAQVTAMQRMQSAQLKKTAVADPFRDLSKGDSGKGGLGEMFKTPDALTFKGGFEEARVAAESEGKLLMVNIQDEQEFASHMLVRRAPVGFARVCSCEALSALCAYLCRTATLGPCRQCRTLSKRTLSSGSSTCRRRRARRSSTFTRFRPNQS
jgi:NACalpha-BTF3-like transcription factor